MKDTIKLSDSSNPEAERVRVLNLLQMYENGALNNPGERLSALALMCKTVVDIRKLNRKLLARFGWKQIRAEDEWVLPVDEWVFVRWNDGHEEWYTYEARDRDDTPEMWEDATHWMAVPPLEDAPAP